MSLSRRHRSHNRSVPLDHTNAALPLLGLRGNIASAHHYASLSIGSAAACASYLHSITFSASNVVPPARHTLPSLESQASPRATRRHEQSSNSQGSYGISARLEISTLLNEGPDSDTKETSEHFSIGLQRRKFGLDLELNAHSSDLYETREVKKLAKEFPRLLWRAYREGSGNSDKIELRDSAAISTSFGRQTKEYGLHYRAAQMSSMSTPTPTQDIITTSPSALLQKPSILNNPTAMSGSLLQSTDTTDKTIASATPTTPVSKFATTYSGTAAVTGRICSSHGKYSLSANTETAVHISQNASAFSESVNLSIAKRRRCCHICRWINEEIERCSACGHRLCIDCEWLELTVPGAGAAQAFTIFEDRDGVGEWDVILEDQRRAMSVYTPSEFEQENSPDKSHIPAVAQKILSRQATIAKDHYTTTQSPTVDSPRASPLDLSHIGHQRLSSTFTSSNLPS